MDFESPDVIKNFPGLYASDLSKKCSNDSDYSDDAEKVTKKDSLIIKRKEKKDKKDKERGYAALEGESSAEEDEARSPSKTKKVKSFKFTSSKSKEKREKSRDKERDVVEKKKDKDKKTEKKIEKEKIKGDKKDKKGKQEDGADIAEGLPIFGVSLDTAVERSRCHDGIDIPLPVRDCVDYIEDNGLNFEGVYKVSGTKSKVVHIKKRYNQRQPVDLHEFDVPTVTSVLKLFLRDLPEPIFTSDLMLKLEEAGAILNAGSREKHLKLILENLPANNKLLLSWLLVHFNNVLQNEQLNKMNMQHLTASLSPALHGSQRVLTALLHHCNAIYPCLTLKPYIPPLTSTAKLPDKPILIEVELKKQESLLLQLHTEMNAGFRSEQREELLWEVQRIITQLKRKIKNAQKESTLERNQEKKQETIVKAEVKESEDEAKSLPLLENKTDEATVAELPEKTIASVEVEEKIEIQETTDKDDLDEDMQLLTQKNVGLLELKNLLLNQIEEEQNDIASIKRQLSSETNKINIPGLNDVNLNTLDEIMQLLYEENQILQIKKINLVRQIMEQHEICIDLKAKLGLFTL